MKFLVIVSLCILKVNSNIQEDAEEFFDELESYNSLDLGFNFRLKPESSNALCNSQLKHFQDSLDENILWARKMRDAWGNVPSGIFSGNQFDFGSFDQCINFQHSAENIGEIIGQHCTLMIPFDIKESKQLARINSYSRSPNDDVGIGICVPKTCLPAEVNELAENAVRENFNISLSSYDQNNLCSLRQDYNGFEGNGLQLFAMVFFGVFLALLILSTSYEVSCNWRNCPKNPVLSSFSVYTNSKTIMTMKPLAKKEMLFLHGIRSLAIIWIVLGHTFSLGVWMSLSINQLDLAETFKNIFTMILFSGFFGVNTFFMLSSLLLTLSVFRELDATNRISLPKLYLKRYFRITVPLAACVIFVLGFFMHLSNGPLWKVITSIHLEFCKDWWWTTLLYIENHVNPGKYCFGHSWYLAVDMQLYFLSPIILYPLWRFRKRFAIMIPLIFLLACSTVVFIIVTYLIYGFRVSLFSENNAVKDVMVYTTTYGRIDSWMIGILVGYIMHSIEGKTVKLSRRVLTIGWTLTALVMLTVVFAQYPLQQESFKENPVIIDAAYDSLKGISWGLSLGWVIIACHLSYGGIVKRFLSLSIWLPISKLSFCIYLIHIPIQVLHTASVRIPEYSSFYRGIFMFCGTFGISFLVAFVWALLFEYPILTIIAILLSKQRAKQSSERIPA